jgi:uncharacterized membrane protein YqiK
MYIAIPAVVIVLIAVVALIFRFIRRKKQGKVSVRNKRPIVLWISKPC